MDLADPRCRDRMCSERLLERILSPSERAWLDVVDDPDRWIVRLWAFWAAKETAFKIRCKLPDSDRVFVPRSLACEMDDEKVDEEGLLRIRGIVRCPDLPLPIRVTGVSNGRHVHVVGWSGNAERSTGGRLETGLEKVSLEEDTPLEQLRGQFTATEWEGVYSLPSAQVRILARDRIRSLLGSGNGPDLAMGPVEVVTAGGPPGRTPPRILFGGRELEGWDVSLSHHGRYVAWALLVPE